MKLLTLSLRNILRNRRRSLITLLAIVVGAVTILIFGGYTNAVVNGVETGFVRQMGHLQIQKRGYFLYGSGSPAEYGIEDYPRVMELIENDPELGPMVRVVTPMLHFFGIAGNFNAGVSRTVAGVGVIPEQQNRLRQWNDYAFPGQPQVLALPEQQPGAAVIGQGVARVLQLCTPFEVPGCGAAPQQARDPGPPAPDDILALAEQEQAAAASPAPDGNPRMEVLAATARGVPNVVSVSVEAVQNQGIKEQDDTFVAMPLALSQKLVYGQDRPRATAIVVQLRHTAQIPQAGARLRALFAERGLDLDVLDFPTLNNTYDQIRGLFGSIFGFVAILMGTIVLFSVANTMSMAVVERTTEIGTLRALGLRRGGVARSFFAEGLLLGCLGAVAGTLLALLLAALINGAGLTWTPPGQVEAIPLVVHLLGDAPLILGTWLGLTLLAALSAVLPAHRAARMPVVDCLRHV